MQLFYQLLLWMCVCTCLCATVCVYANGFRLHLKATNYLKLIASNVHMYIYVLNAIEIGNVRACERVNEWSG